MDALIREARTDADRTACLDVRARVFVGEQGVLPQEEQDGQDPDCTHVLLEVAGEVAGAARYYVRDDGLGKIQRVCVDSRHRGGGHGAALIRFILQALEADPRARGAVLGAQTQAIAFYERLGFTAVGPEYLDARIPHRDMELLF